MNYLLHYDNARPLFIGGHSHGKTMPVRPNAWHGEMVSVLTVHPISFHRMDCKDASLDKSPLEIHTETYRAEWFVANDRKFKLMVHDALPVDAALMLMLSTVGETAALKDRIRHLERENAELKAVLRGIEHIFEMPSP